MLPLSQGPDLLCQSRINVELKRQLIAERVEFVDPGHVHANRSRRFRLVDAAAKHCHFIRNNAVLAP